MRRCEDCRDRIWPWQRRVGPSHRACYLAWERDVAIPAIVTATAHLKAATAQARLLALEAVQQGNATEAWWQGTEAMADWLNAEFDSRIH